MLRPECLAVLLNQTYASVNGLILRSIGQAVAAVDAAHLRFGFRHDWDGLTALHVEDQILKACVARAAPTSTEQTARLLFSCAVW